MTIEDVKVIIQGDETRTLEMKKTTGELKDVFAKKYGKISYFSWYYISYIFLFTSSFILLPSAFFHLPSNISHQPSSLFHLPSSILMSFSCPHAI